MGELGFNEPYFWTQYWTQAWGGVSQTRESAFLSWNSQQFKIFGKSSGAKILSTLYCHTLELHPSVDSIGAIFCLTLHLESPRM